MNRTEKTTRQEGKGIIGSWPLLITVMVCYLVFVSWLPGFQAKQHIFSGVNSAWADNDKGDDDSDGGDDHDSGDDGGDHDRGDDSDGHDSGRDSGGDDGGRGESSGGDDGGSHDSGSESGEHESGDDGGDRGDHDGEDHDGSEHDRGDDDGSDHDLNEDSSSMEQQHDLDVGESPSDNGAANAEAAVEPDSGSAGDSSPDVGGDLSRTGNFGELMEISEDEEASMLGHWDD